MEVTERFNWDIEYSVGVAEIDNQHKELMKLVNNLISHSSDTKTERKLFFHKVIEIANNRLANHFDTEERVLSRTSYEKLTDHKKEHENLTSRVKAIRSEVGSNNEDLALYDLTLILKEYFLSHILLYDKEAKDFFKTGSDMIAPNGFLEGIV